MKIYKANRKGLIHILLIGSALLPVVVYCMDKKTFANSPFMLFPLLIPFILVAWLYFDTFYKIENGQLIYHSGFLKGKIEIRNIKESRKEKRCGAELNLH